MILQCSGRRPAFRVPLHAPARPQPAVTHAAPPPGTDPIAVTQPMLPPAPPPDRRVDCSVLWAALTAYAEADVRTQVDQREALHRAAARALEGVPPEDRIVLETDLGLAVCFLGGPPVAARAAGTLRSPGEGGTVPPLALGLSHGPVAVLSEADSVPRLIGDGVLVAERMAGFAATGQVLASRAFTDAAAPGPARDRAFRALGSRTDAQLRAHEVFELLPEGASALLPSPASEPEPAPRGLGLAGPLAAVAALVAGAGLLAALLMPARRPAPVVHPPAAPTPVASVIPAPAPASPAASRPAAASTASPESTAPSDTETIATDPAPPGIAAKTEPAAAHPSPPDSAQSPPARAVAGPPAKAVIGLAVSPWGEVFVNGRRAGVSPPLTTISVAAGRVTVELRNGDAPPYRETLQLAPGDEVRVRHRF